MVAAGLKIAVTPAGRPETLKLTVPLKPATGATLILVDVLPYGTTDMEEGAESEKSEIHKGTEAAKVELPLVPVTVRG